jgi:cytochrome b561
MGLRSSAEHWGTISRWFHWGFALALLFMVGLGLYMADLPVGLYKLKVYALHKSIGLTLLALAVLRLLWRLLELRPTLPTMPLWQHRAASSVHVGLYLLMFLIPLSGWLYNSVAGFPLQWFHLVNLPALHGADKALKPLVRDSHEFLAWTLVVAVLLHAGAALKHHFVDRDPTLALMIPFLKPKHASKGSP